jgi:serine phosphatase RsbU (regulator of sigma subunit)
MSLRARLIWAFFLLAVVPLCGITLYSYLSTERAYRRAVEAETSALAEDLHGRLGSAAHDLDRRLERVTELPFVAASDEKSPDEAMHKLLADVRSEIGDVAPLVESLEFQPKAPTGPPPVPAARQPKGPRPEAKATVAEAPKAIVIAPEPPPAAVPPPPSGTAGPQPAEPPRWVFKYKETADAWAAAGREIAREAQRAAQEVEREARQEHEQAEREARAAEREARREAQAEARKQRETQLARLRDELRKKAESGDGTAALRHVGEMIFQGKQDFLKSFGFTFRYPVRRRGADVGTVQAQVNPQQLLADVFARTRRRQGELPFALDDSGQLYAAGSDRQRLDALRVTEAAAGGKKTGVLKVKEDWVVVARRDPKSGLTLGIARPLGEGLRALRRTALTNLSFGMTGLALVGILPLSRRLTRDLQAVTDGANRLAHGDLGARVTVRSKDEVGRLAATFNHMADELQRHQAQLLEQERLRKELELGRRIQEEMLPHDRLRVPFAEAKGLSIPAREVGGDFFNYFPLDAGQAALIVGDVSGKGVGAALLMANLQATLRARLPLEKDLSALAGHLDAEIDASTSTTVYLTAFIGVLEGDRRVMRYVNAGHNPPLLLRGDGRVESLDSTGRPLGLLPGGEYEERQVALDEGDWLLLYTDGVVESEDDRGEPFGAGRLQQLLRGAGDGGLDDILARVEQAVREHRGGREAEDDATLVVLRVGPSASS